jgi:hypothetical protein
MCIGWLWNWKNGFAIIPKIISASGMTVANPLTLYISKIYENI